jgi:hypothetical protein
VFGLDILLPDYGGGQSFLASLGALSRHLPVPGPFAAFLQGRYDCPESQAAQPETLQAELNTRRSEVVASWGEGWYDTVSEIVEVELTSIPVRALRESDYDESVHLREEAIEQLADRTGSLPLDDPLFGRERKRC